MQPYHRIRNRQLCKPDGRTSFADERTVADSTRPRIVRTNYRAVTRRPCARCLNCRIRNSRRDNGPIGPTDTRCCRCSGCVKSFRHHFVGGRR